MATKIKAVAKRGMNVKKSVEIGAGVLAGAAALAAGYYFYASKDAKNHRKVAVSWAKGLKSEVLKEVTKVKSMSKAPVMSAIDKAVKVYAMSQNIDKAEVASVVRELKANWQALAGEIKGSTKSAGTSAKKTVGRVIKKVGSK